MELYFNHKEHDKEKFGKHIQNHIFGHQSQGKITSVLGNTVYLRWFMIDSATQAKQPDNIVPCVIDHHSTVGTNHVNPSINNSGCHF